MATYYVDEDGNVTTGKKKKKKGATYTVDLDGKVTKVEEDISPVKEEKEEEVKRESKGLFQAGAFADGYQFGDIAKTIHSTGKDVELGIVKGLGNFAEGITDLALYGVSGVSKLVGADSFADDVKNLAQKQSVNDFFAPYEEKVNKNSLIGGLGDSITQGVGQVGGIILTGGLGKAAGLGSAAVSALSTGTMFASSTGSGMGEAYQGGASDKEAVTYGTIKGAVDAGTELIFGGLGKTVNALGISRGISSLDDIFARKLSNKISNQAVKTLTEYGVKASAEGVEEVLAGLGSAVAKDLTYMKDEDLQQLIKDENLLEQFVVGAVTSGIVQGGSAVNSIKTETDYITGLTKNEETVIEKEVEKRIAEKETDGKALTKRERDAIREQVTSDLEKGYISIDTIESALGGETYQKYQDAMQREKDILSEYEELGKVTTPSLAQQARYAELTKEVKYIKENPKSQFFKEQLGREVGYISRDSRLSESYKEKERKTQTFEADLTKYDEKQGEVVKKAVESGILNNSNRTHEFVDMVAKISADKGVLFDFTNNQKLKESGFAVEGATVNGFVKDGNISLNIDSSKSLNSVVGHEITHVLEGTELYGELQKAVKEYATSKGEYDTRLQSITKLYEGIESANIDSEITADLVGDYLFTDSDFITNLSIEKPNVFKKIFDEIKYLYKVATAGSKEARQLEKVKRSFEKAYKEVDKPVTDSEVDTETNKAQHEYENYNVYGKDVALAPTPQVASQSDIAPVQEPTQGIAQNNVQNIAQETIPDDYAPMTEEQANERDAQQMDSLYSLDENTDMPPETEAPYNEEATTESADPFYDRDIQEVGKRNVKAYMYENPEVKPYFQQEAYAMLGELQNSIKGEKTYNSQLYYETGGQEGWFGTKRHTSDEIAYLLDKFRYSYADLEKGLNAIIEDNGKENNAISKRIEFMLDARLRTGYTYFLTGDEIPPNQEYINLLNEKQITEYNDYSWNEWLQNLSEEQINELYGQQMQEDFAPTKESFEVAKEMQEDIPIEELPFYEAPVKEDEASRPPSEKGSKTESEIAERQKGKENPLGKQRKWVETSTESEPVDRKILPKDLDQTLIHYQPISNKVTLGNANAKLGNMGYDASVKYFNSQFMNKSVSLDDIALGERLIQEAVKSGDYETAGELIQNVSILGTELGQKVQALSIIQRLTPEGQLKMLQKTVQRGKVKGDKAYENVELTQEMIDKILKTYGKDGSYDQKKLNKAVEDVKQELANQMQVTMLDKVNAWRYLAMLGNPKTHIRNLVSNVAMRGTLATKNAVARTIETVAPISDRTKIWQPATKAVKKFAEQTTLEMKDVITGDSKYSDDTTIKQKRAIFKNKVLNSVYEFNSNMLEKEDWWFSKPAFTNAFSEYLTANGIRTEQDIKNNPKVIEKAKVYATDQSQIATFRQYSWLANQINNIERHNTATNIAVGAVLPFKKTPVNIAKTGLNYSPLGFMKTLTYDIPKVKKGDMEASELIDHLSQNMVGSSLALVGYLLAISGFLSGGGEDDKEGKYDSQLGEQTYAINIGGKSYSLSWLSPIAMPIFVGANAYEQLVQGKEWNGDVVIETLAQTLDPLSEMSFLSSLDSVLSSYDRGIQKFAGIAQTAAQSYVTQFVPTLSSQVATVLDDTKRSTKIGADSGFKAFDQTVNAIKYKIPFLRETLEPTINIWGEDVKQTDNVLVRALETFIAPYSVREDITSNIDKEIKSLYAETGDNGIIPSIPYNYTNYDGVKYEMSANEHAVYKRIYGQTANELLRDLFTTNTYKSASSEDKAEMVNKVYDYANDEAKRELLAKRGVEFTNATKEGIEYYKENPIKGAIENDMSVDEYSFYTSNPEKYAFFQKNNLSYADYKAADEDGKRAYTWAYENPEKYEVSKAISSDLLTYKQYTKDISALEADKDESGKTISGSRKEKVIEYINNLDADYGEKIILFKSEYNADDTYNADIVEYLNGREDISYEQMKTILKELGFTVYDNGRVEW